MVQMTEFDVVLRCGNAAQLQRRWDITFARLTYQSAEHGEAEEEGYLHRGLTFREAMDVLRGARGCHVEADSHPACLLLPPRWFHIYRVEHDMATGDVINYALHIPPHITPASRLRVARLLGCHVVK